VVEPGRRSIETAQRIFELAKDLNLKHIAIVGNKIQNPSQKDFILKSLPDAEFLGFIPYDKAIIDADLANRSILNSSQPILAEITNIYKALISTAKNTAKTPN
jgi:CO dehydrogenase maturation factor